MTATTAARNLPAAATPSQLPAAPRMEVIPPPPPVPENPPAARWGRIGLAITIGGFGGFVLWAALFPLAGGAFAPGMVRLSDEKQVVAHVEGGIIRRLGVSEGEKVTAGQELVVLDDYNSETNLAILEKRRWELMAKKSRLEAVRDGLNTIIFPAELTDHETDRDIREVMATQQRQFAADRTDLDGQKAILLQQTTQYDAIITSLRTQIESGSTQLDLINQEVQGVQMLLDKGLERKPRLLALQRQQAALSAQRADLEGRIASYNEKIGEIKLQMVNLDADARAKAVAELSETQTNLNQTQEQWANAKTRSRELTLRAAHDGVVLNLRYRSEGAVVPQGQPIMEIVPTSKVFVVDARILPSDIDVVHSGLPAQIRLTGLKQRTHVTLNGEVMRVSPDALMDTSSGTSFFEARVAFDANDPEFKKVAEASELYAGMPAEVIVVAHKRTMLQYLMQPMADSFARSFHEE